MSKEGNKQQPAPTPAVTATAPTTKPAQAPEAPQQKKDYIGCLMSLISKQEIRYVGTLIAINSKDQTLVLQNVKTYGSEGRRGGGPEELPASSQTYEKVVFRATELKDFSVIKGPEKDFKDPAILSTEKVEEKKEEKKQPAATGPAPATTSQPEPYYAPNYYEEKESYHPQYEHGGRRGRGHYQRGRGGPRRTEGSFEEHTVKEVQEKYGGEFDFEAMNKKVESLFKEVKPEVGTKYDKGKSFYDSISRGKEEKPEGTFDRTKQRQLDADTFDLDPNYERRGGYRGYRGGNTGGRYYRRGRGGRGRGGEGGNYYSPGRRGQYRRRAQE